MRKRLKWFFEGMLAAALAHLAACLAFASAEMVFRFCGHVAIALALRVIDALR